MDKRPHTLSQQILDTLAATGPASSASLSAKLGCSGHQIAAACGKLKLQNLIHRQRGLERRGPGFRTNRHKRMAIWATSPDSRKECVKTKFKGAINVTRADLEWMQYWRDHAQQRQQRPVR